MPIVPLPVFEAEADPKVRGLSDEEIKQYERLTPPETIVVRYGYMRQVGEFPARIDIVPGCGTKFVIRSPRGTELADMLTTTCANGGCGMSITRKQMLEYIDNSGGRQYPFTNNGRILRVATPTDLEKMSEINGKKREILKRVRTSVNELGLKMDVVEVEQILGEEVLTIFYMAEDRVDFRDMVKILSRELSTRIEMRQVGARDEARLTADYERCGQHCCCKQFLKVLKPISMRAAKMQKATLDPLKISGRCGRLMCCLRYEDQTYTELKKNLPRRKSRVGTPDGPGMVLNGQILTQLVLVELEGTRQRIAVPVEELCDPDECPPKVAPDPFRGMSKSDVTDKVSSEGGGKSGGSKSRKRRRRGGKGKSGSQDGDSGAADRQAKYRERSQQEGAGGDASGNKDASGTDGSSTDGKKRKRRRRRKKSDSSNQSGGGATQNPPDTSQPQGNAGDATGGDGEGGGPKKRKRRRRRRKRRGDGEGGGGDGGGGGGGDGGGGGGGGGDGGGSGPDA